MVASHVGVCNHVGESVAVMCESQASVESGPLLASAVFAISGAKVESVRGSIDSWTTRSGYTTVSVGDPRFEEKQLRRPNG